MQDVYVYLTPDKNVICVTTDYERLIKCLSIFGITCKKQSDDYMELYAGNCVLVGTIHKTYMADFD